MWRRSAGAIRREGILRINHHLCDIINVKNGWNLGMPSHTCVDSRRWNSQGFHWIECFRCFGTSTVGGSADELKAYALDELSFIQNININRMFFYKITQQVRILFIRIFSYSF